MKNILLLLSILLVISSCKPGEVANGGNKKKTEKLVLKKMIESDIDFAWFSAKVKANYQSPAQSMTVTLQVKIEKDKAIWISGQKFGLEGVRLLIEQDSIQVLNRLERSYMVTDFSYIEKEFNLPANFEAVQDFLIGNALKMGDDAVYNLKDAELQTVLIAVENTLRATYALNKLTYNLEFFQLDDTETNRQMTTKQSGYEVVEGKGDFSYLRQVEFKDEKSESASVDMSFSRVDFDIPKTMSFSVPSSYKRL
ncbi:MAG: hypothetical protein ACJAUH_001427 [Saprospiraceae bacterium]|jgi:hypothetical protein